MKTQVLLLCVGLVSLLYGASTLDQRGQPKSQAQKLFARAKPDDYMGEQGCADCHADKVAAFKNSPHSACMLDPKLPLEKRGCEGCHGPGYIHRADENPEVIAFTKMSPEESSAACLRCHEQTLNEKHWKKSAHSAAGLSCVSCHQIHPDSPNDLAAKSVAKADARVPAFVARVEPATMLLKADQMTLCGQCHAAEITSFRSNSHHPVPEGRMQCSDCHSAHPTKNDRLTGKTNKDACVSCHSEYAGPFIYEHEPVAGNTGDGCLECHSPHGTNNPQMLNSFSRGLCGQCHTEKLSQHHPGQTCWSAGCHVSPHGSNTDPRFLHP